MALRHAPETVWRLTDKVRLHSAGLVLVGDVVVVVASWLQVLDVGVCVEHREGFSVAGVVEFAQGRSCRDLALGSVGSLISGGEGLGRRDAECDAGVDRRVVVDEVGQEDQTTVEAEDVRRGRDRKSVV